MPETIAILSDTHLTTKFDERKLNYLKSLFLKHDQIIINGDFWSYYSCTFDEFLKSKWSRLFPVMKDKTIYIYGNHDREKWCDERVGEFCKSAADSYILSMENTKLIVMHGHKIATDSVQNEPYLKIQRFLDIDKYNYFIQEKIVKHVGLGFYTKLGQRINSKQKSYAKGLEDKETLVAAHSHTPEFSPKDKYINTGFINYGFSSYLKIFEGNMTLAMETY